MLDVLFVRPTAVWLGIGLMLLSASGITRTAAIEIEDDSERQLYLQAPAQRIVSLAPHLSELVYFAGALDKLVGVSAHCDYPAEVQKLSKVSDYRNINYENLMRLQPDLILAWRSGVNAVQLEKLTRLFKHVYVSSPNSFNDIADNLSDLGQLAGTSYQADRQARSFLKQINKLQKQRSGHRYRALYLIAAQPLITISEKHWISKTMAICGADNAFKKRTGPLIWLSREALLLEPLDVVVHSMHDDAALRVLLPETPAIYIDPDTIQRPTPRLIDGAVRLCKRLKKL